MSTQETIFQLALHTAKTANYEAMGLKPYDEVSEGQKRLRVEFFIEQLLKIIND